MKKVEGNIGVRLLECINPIKNKWRVRWDVQPGENGSATYMEEGVRPSTHRRRDTLHGHNMAQPGNRQGYPIRFHLRECPGMVVKREPVQLQGSLRPCRANSRGDSSGRVQIRDGHRTGLSRVCYTGRPDRLLYESHAAYPKHAGRRMEKERCI